MTPEIFNRLVAPLRRRVQMMVGRGVVSAVDDGPRAQVLQLEMLADEVTEAERFESYGLTSVPHPGAEAIVVFPGGLRSHGIVAGVVDRRHRPRSLAAGEVALYDDQGQRALIARDGVRITTSLAASISAEQSLELGTDGAATIDAGATLALSSAGATSIDSGAPMQLSAPAIALDGPVSMTTPLPVASGGTGVASQAGLLAFLLSLGLAETGSEEGEESPILTALAGLGAEAGMIEQTGPTAFAKRAIGAAAGTSIPTIADADARYQAADAELSAIAALFGAADRLPYFTGPGAAALAVFTAFARQFVAAADAVAARAALVLDNVENKSSTTIREELTAANVTGGLGYTPSSVTGLAGVQTVPAFKLGLALAKADVGLGNAENKSSATIRSEITSADVTTALTFTPTSVVGLTGAQTVAAFKAGLVLVKADVGLGAVDNVSDANKPVSTAQQTALNARQPLDAELTAVAGLASAADKLPYFTGSGTASMADFTPVARTLLAQATQALMRTTGLGLGTSSTVDTGTSGAKVPLLSGANTWSVAQTFNAVVDAAGIRATGVSIPATGAGVEIMYTGGEGYISSYDRAAATLKPLKVNASRLILMNHAALVNAANDAAAATAGVALGEFYRNGSAFMVRLA